MMGSPAGLAAGSSSIHPSFPLNCSLSLPGPPPPPFTHHHHHNHNLLSLVPGTCALPQSMQVVLITPPTTAPSEVHDVNRMFDAGLPVLHLRKPAADTAALRRYLQDINPQYLNRVVVHQHHPLAKEFVLKGVHYKERDRPQPPLPRFAEHLSQSTSLHSIADVLQDWKNLDYAFLGPIFDSISKEGYTAAGFNPPQVAEALQRAQMPVYALGGVDVTKMSIVRGMGFQGVGLLGAVWGADDPLAALQEFLAAADGT